MQTVVTIRAQQDSLPAVLAEFRTESGRTLLELLDESPILLIFLRHFGCSFCRETIERISGLQEKLNARSVRPVFVHLGSPDRARPYFDYYELSAVERVSNPDGSLYAQPAFQLPRKHVLLHFLVPSNWLPWLKVVARHGTGLLEQDAHQMPGVFFLRDRTIVRSFRYRTLADQPNYIHLIS